VKTCTVAGFPLGASSTAAKVAETLDAIAQGATEVDMVINIGALKGGEASRAEVDIGAVASATHRGGAILKVIIETALLDREQKILACQLAVRAGADFVKTSTGFAKAGATVEDIQLMRATVGPDIGVKASGGVRTLNDLKAMVAAGATRVGASASVAIIEATAL
jgi:deoxyribose-phosphate aldolase